MSSKFECGRAARVGRVLALLAGAAIMILPAAAAIAAAPRPAYTRNVAVVVYEGVEILDFSGPSEVFAAAAGFGRDQGQPAFNVYTVAVSKEPVTSQGFVKVVPNYSIADAPKPDIVVIPGGNSSALTDNSAFMAWAKKATDGAQISLTVCTGAFVLSKLGRLDGAQATTWYGAIAALRDATPKATVQEGRRFVDNGTTITTAGVSAGIDGALHVVARLLGRSVADRTARYMEYHWTPEPYLSQSYTFLNPSLDEGGRRMQQAGLLEDEKNYDQAIQAYRALLDQDAQNGFAWYRLGAALQSAKQLDAAADANKRAAEFPQVRANALYNLACVQALQGRTDGALQALEQAIAAGFKSRGSLQQDPDLATLRADARFQKLVASL